MYVHLTIVCTHASRVVIDRRCASTAGLSALLEVAMSHSRRAARSSLTTTLAVGAIGLVSLAIAGGGLGEAEAAGSADSLVYIKDGNVYIAHSDGTQARAITNGVCKPLPGRA
jgi:hypothetical protein